MWKWRGLFIREYHLLRCWGWLSILNWIGVLTLSLLLKLPSRKLEPWSVLWSFFLLRLLCISINLPYSFAWNTVVVFGLLPPSRYLELLDKLQNRTCRTVGPSLAASLEPLAHRRNVATLSLFRRHYFGRCSSELVQLVPLPYSRGRSTRYSDRWIFSHHSYMLQECLSQHIWNCWNYDPNGFKSRINRTF